MGNSTFELCVILDSVAVKEPVKFSSDPMFLSFSAISGTKCSYFVSLKGTYIFYVLPWGPGSRREGGGGGRGV